MVASEYSGSLSDEIEESVGIMSPVRKHSPQKATKTGM